LPDPVRCDICLVMMQGECRKEAQKG
jgi:hypothetical protein